MAYPASAVVFTVRNAGDVIQAAHVNDLQTEVTAIESAMLSGGLAHNLVPATDNARSLGSSAARWIFSGSQITPGSIPSTTLSTTGTPSSGTYLTGTGWAAAANAIYSLIKSTNGVSTAVGAVNLSTMAITGLTANDRLKVSIGLKMSGAISGAFTLYNVTDGVVLYTVSASMSSAQALAYEPTIMQHSTSSTTIWSAAYTGTITQANVATAWTAPWELALRSSSLAAGAQVNFNLAVFKVAGQ